MTTNNRLIAVAVASVFLITCGRNDVPQKTPEPVVIQKHTRDTIYLTNEDFAVGDDCSQAVTAMHNSNLLLAKCEADVNLLLADNEALRTELSRKCPNGKTIIRNSFNQDNREVTTLRNSNQQLAKDNAVLHAENAKLADKLKEKPKEVTKTDNSTKNKGSKFWLGVLVATAVFQGLKQAKRYVPPPFNIILGFLA